MHFRPSGITRLEHFPWGTHCCFFYRSKDELIDIIIPYLNAGLENNECCIWLTSDSISSLEALEALEKLAKNGINPERALADGQLRIEKGREFYNQAGDFDPRRLLSFWMSAAENTKSLGMEGLRICGDAFWAGFAEKKYYHSYETAIDEALQGEVPIISLCTYHLERCDPFDVAFAANAHEYSLISNNGALEIIDNLGRRRAEAAHGELQSALEGIREREARLQSIFRTSPVGIGLIEVILENGDVKQRIIREANDRLCEILGYSKDEVVGNDIRMLYDSEEAYYDTGRNNYIQLFEHGIASVETRWKCKNGEMRDFVLSSAPVNPSDWSEGISFTAKDVTEQKRSEADRQKLEQQLRQSQKMEAVGKLAGGVAHDFNNLLQIINGYADMMHSDLPSDHPGRRNTEEIMRAGEKAGGLVRQLLAFSRRQIMQLEPIYLNDLIRNLMKMIRRIIGEHIQIDFIPGKHLGLVKADPGQLEQVLMNLCVNARDAMAEHGGILTLETENVLINGTYCETHAWAESGRYVLLNISDTGCGMDTETTNRIFEPFFTTKAVNEGTGLGLSTAYGIIRQHQGMIQVYSEPGKGTRFKIYLPLLERNAVEVGSSIKSEPPGGNETIFLAEDDEMVRLLMRTVLERAGYTTIAASDGQEAIEIFASNAELIDLAVIDVVMPKCSGREVHDAIKKSHPDVPVLFSSGYSTNAIHTNFILHQGLDLIQKPFAIEDLLITVREKLDRNS